MARPEASEEDKIIETWESQVASTIFVWVYDRREDRYIKQAVGGRSASKRLHITRDDRKWNQEQIPVENQQHDPFSNGALKLTNAATRDESLNTRYHLTDDDLREIFEIRDSELFVEAINDIGSELVLRRMAALSEDVGTMSQINALKDMLQQRYPIGGTQRSVREMIEAGERLPR